MKKIGIMTFHASLNCGSMLQAYALQTVLSEKYKADVEIVLNNGERMVRKVIGSHQGQLITMDNELIPVNQIQDIYFRE